MSVPVIVALLARIQDELQSDEVTQGVAANLACSIAELIALREKAWRAMKDVETEIERGKNDQGIRAPNRKLN